jgi:hypothetical protein
MSSIGGSRNQPDLITQVPDLAIHRPAGDRFAIRVWLLLRNPIRSGRPSDTATPHGFKRKGELDVKPQLKGNDSQHRNFPRSHPSSRTRMQIDGYFGESCKKLNSGSNGATCNLPKDMEAARRTNPHAVLAWARVGSSAASPAARTWPRGLRAVVRPSAQSGEPCG